MKLRILLPNNGQRSNQIHFQFWRFNVLSKFAELLN
jgi:hypothetical protein